MKWIKPFLLCAGGILLMAALTRFLIATGNAQVMALPDPMLGIPLRYAVLAVGAIELIVALICLFGRHVGLQIGWLAWLRTNYIVFWIGLLAMHIHPQATGIGIFTDPLRIHRGMTGYVFTIIPFCLALGSYAAAVSILFSTEARTADENGLSRLRRACQVRRPKHWPEDSLSPLPGSHHAVPAG